MDDTPGTPGHTRLRYLPESDGEPGADEPGSGSDTDTDTDTARERPHEEDLDEDEAARARYVTLPGRTAIDLEALSDLSLD